jgi:acyl-CoA reductase-like NAD-dependent aldehyde dehydrogenase
MSATLPHTKQGQPTLQSTPYKMLIGNEWVASRSGNTFPVLNPSNNEQIAEVYAASEPEIEQAVAAARQGFAAWSKLTPRDRGDALLRLAELLRADAERLAFIETIDVGGTINGARYFGIPQGIDAFVYNAGLARTIHGEVIPISNGDYLNYRVHEPLGVVAEIVPWNGPFMMGCQKVAAILAAGNAVILKPPRDGSLSLLALGEYAIKAGLPPGVLNILTGGGEAVGEALVRHPGVDMVSVTGSTATGQRVMALAAQSIKRVALELGGKSPNVVFPDANLDEAVVGAAQAGFNNSGQICVCGSRLILHRSIYDGFVERLKAEIETWKLGDALDEQTRLGPLISRSQQQKVLDYIEIGKREGATLITGGSAPTDPALARGNYVLPTIFAGAHNQMCIAQEEIFGPVLAVIPFETEDEAVEIANDTTYGLAAGVWTRDVQRGIRMMRRLNAGQTYLNGYYSPAMIESPAEGHKQSGLGGAGILKYTVEKTVFIKVS